MPHPSRHADALRTALYNLHKLDQHIRISRRMLNDLRTLRRLIGQERTGSLSKTKSERRSVSVLPAGNGVSMKNLFADEIQNVA